MKEEDNMDDLLVKQLLNETTREENERIAKWSAGNMNNRNYARHFELIWHKSKLLANQSSVDEAEAWERFRSRVDQPRQLAVVPLNRWKGTFVLRIAAMLLLVAGAGWAAWFYAAQNRNNDLMVFETDMSTRTDTLPDGSVVTLNKHSRLSFPEHFAGNRRDVKLTGEGFFNVVPDKSRPFTISVNDITVKVVGTSFNIKENKETTEVIVETGIVEVARNDQKLKIKPKEKTIVDKGATKLYKQKSEDEFYNYYRTGRLVCEHTPLSRVVGILNEAYGTEIVIANEQLKTLSIDTTFEQMNLEEILSLISATLDIRVTRNGNRITLNK